MLSIQYPFASLRYISSFRFPIAKDPGDRNVCLSLQSLVPEFCLTTSDSCLCPSCHYQSGIFTRRTRYEVREHWMKIDGMWHTGLVAKGHVVCSNLLPVPRRNERTLPSPRESRREVIPLSPRLQLKLPQCSEPPCLPIDERHDGVR